jgi:DNA-binding CsgD family transcriptional regulator
MLQGREAEQRKLDGLLRRARAGRSAVLVLRGEPGIGKTALLGYAASRAEGMRVLSAAGVETEAEIAFAGLYSLLHPLAGQLSALPVRQAAVLRAALGLGGGPALAAPDRLAVAAGTHGLLTAAAALQPLLVLVDDVHWLDPATAGALAFAVRRLGSDAVTCVLSTRPGSSVLDGLPVHDLAGLREPDAALLVQAVSGITPAPAVARRLHAGTGGNPLALTELAASLTAQQLTGAGLPEIPDLPLQPGAGVQHRYTARLASLDPAVRLTLLVAAAAGTCPATAVMAAAAQLGGSEALAEAEDARLVRLTAGGMEFCHPLVRSVAYHTAPPSRRRAAHHALARTLAGGDPERAAWHLAATATGADESAAAALDRAAVLAERKGAPLVAAATWERASELSETSETGTERMLQAAESALRAGDLDRAGRLASTPAVGLAPAHRARLLAVRGHLDMLLGRLAAAQRNLREAAELTKDHDPQLAAALATKSVRAAIEAGLPNEANQSGELLARMSAHSDQVVQFLADLARGDLEWIRGNPHEGLRLLRRSTARLETDPAIASSTERQLDATAAWAAVGHLHRARRHAECAVELARDEGALGLLPQALATAAFCDGETGNWQQALALGSQALDLAQAANQAYLACDVLITMISIEAAQGRDQDCRAHAHQADRLAAGLGLPWQQLLTRRHLALLEFGNGRLEEAIACYEQLRTLAVDSGLHHPYLSPIPDLIEAYARAGELDRARELLPEFVAQVPDDYNPLPAARAERCRGILAGNDFEAHFQHALTLHARGEVVFQHARTHLCYGERLRRARRRRDARAQLRAAIEIFDRLDARPWTDRARAELLATGETITDPGQVHQRLTPQELQIALLVAQGQTNAEVGRAIFLSTRTVEFHLSRAYRKLGVATRTELTSRLISAGPAGI